MKNTKKTKRKRRKSRYSIIAKIGAEDFKKWRCNNLLSLAEFLDRDHPTWRWFNVYCGRTKEQLGSFTKNNKPTDRYI